MCNMCCAVFGSEEYSVVEQGYFDYNNNTDDKLFLFVISTIILLGLLFS